MKKNNAQFQLNEISSYYSKKNLEHGDTPQGVDWNGEIGQSLRFEKLLGSLDLNSPFSINDLGCGYGALLTYLKMSFKDIQYYGYDISETMISSAKTKFKSDLTANFYVASEPKITADITVASGIFNVRLNHSDSYWQEYILSTLENMHQKSSKGFSFNCLSKYSDVDKRRDYLYYADPLILFDFCKTQFSRNVSLLHDYNLYEFTILVKNQQPS